MVFVTQSGARNNVGSPLQRTVLLFSPVKSAAPASIPLVKRENKSSRPPSRCRCSTPHRTEPRSTLWRCCRRSASPPSARRSSALCQERMGRHAKGLGGGYCRGGLAHGVCPGNALTACAEKVCFTPEPDVLPLFGQTPDHLGQGLLTLREMRSPTSSGHADHFMFCWVKQKRPELFSDHTPRHRTGRPMSC